MSEKEINKTSDYLNLIDSIRIYYKKIHFWKFRILETKNLHVKREVKRKIKEIRSIALNEIRVLRGFNLDIPPDIGEMIHEIESWKFKSKNPLMIPDQDNALKSGAKLNDGSGCEISTSRIEINNCSQNYVPSDFSPKPPAPKPGGRDISVNRAEVNPFEPNRQAAAVVERTSPPSPSPRPIAEEPETGLRDETNSLQKGNDAKMIPFESGGYTQKRTHINSKRRTINVSLPSASPKTLRLDAAVPEKVSLDKTFLLAVSIRLPSSAKLNEAELNLVRSGDLLIIQPKGVPYTRIRIEVNAPGCEIRESDNPAFRLYPGHDSPIIFFHLTPRQIGEISIVVKVFQKKTTLGAMRLLTKSLEQEIGEVRLNPVSKPLDRSVEEKAGYSILTNAANILLGIVALGIVTNVISAVIAGQLSSKILWYTIPIGLMVGISLIIINLIPKKKKRRLTN